LYASIFDNLTLIPLLFNLTKKSLKSEALGKYHLGADLEYNLTFLAHSDFLYFSHSALLISLIKSAVNFFIHLLYIILL
jgi:hypothetical protein